MLERVRQRRCWEKNKDDKSNEKVIQRQKK